MFFALSEIIWRTTGTFLKHHGRFRKKAGIYFWSKLSLLNNPHFLLGPYFARFPFECRLLALTNDFRVLLLSTISSYSPMQRSWPACPSFAPFVTLSKVLASFVTLSKVLVALSFRLFTQLSLFLQRLIFCDMKYWQCLFIYFLAWQYPFQFPINLFHASPDLTYCRKKVVKLHHKHSISGQ